jgi:chorismate mutase
VSDAIFRFTTHGLSLVGFLFMMNILDCQLYFHSQQADIIMPCRGIRGATTCEENTSASILKATRELLALMIRRNDIQPEDVASAIFSTTEDLNAEFPALAARQLGWLDVALMCVHEIDVPDSLRRCIRILLHWNTNKPADQLVHVYIKEAAHLRPDRTKIPPIDWEALEQWIEANLDKSVQSARK